MFENYFVNRFAYVINGNPFYFANFKRGDETTGYAILSPSSNNKEDHLKAMEPLLHYSVAIRNITTDIKYRASIDFSILYEVRDYLRNVTTSDVLNNGYDIIYNRALNIIQSMIDSQEELKEAYQNAIEKYENDKEKGYITDEDISEMKGYLSIFMRLQYKQFRDRYDNRSDFDIIFEKRNEKEINQFESFTDSNTLREMTSKRAEKDLESALREVSFGKDLRGKTYVERDRLGLEYFQNELDNLLEYVKNNLRNP